MVILRDKSLEIKTGLRKSFQDQNSKFANHIHIEGGKGKWKNTIQAANSRGTYVIENQYNLEKMFILGQDVKILDGQGYDWKIEQKPQPVPDNITDLINKINLLTDEKNALQSQLEQAKILITNLEVLNTTYALKLQSINQESEI